MHESHPLFAELTTERLWAITPDALSSLDAMLASSNGKDTAPAPRAAATASHGGGPLLYAVREGVAVIDISGTIHRYGDPEWDAVGHDTIKAAVSLAMRDRSASALLLRFNSPGGVAPGVPELAAWLAAQTAKPVYAYADGLCASAAYYLAAATGRVYAPATATVGSIGVICRHMDWSGFLEKCGVRVTHLTGGAWKAAGNDAEPLTDEVKAYLQQPINELHTMFRADVAAHMPVDAAAPETWGDGQVFLASRAHELGLVTGIVPGMDALIALINTTKEKPMDRIELAPAIPNCWRRSKRTPRNRGPPKPTPQWKRNSSRLCRPPSTTAWPCSRRLPEPKPPSAWKRWPPPASPPGSFRRSGRCSPPPRPLRGRPPGPRRNKPSSPT
ncbi:S49 family peptidase [Bilophila wadsworthia]|uniref:S49 family peptidase n=1 Tax=Bilophila wadsworthia TaxID=35833 RepID=UPI001D6771B9|nr:S49 family peptidase [Bilophila wadsworthia]MBS5374924.1 S49 family peptidase [Bilophila wadsworthia]